MRGSLFLRGENELGKEEGFFVKWGWQAFENKFFCQRVRKERIPLPTPKMIRPEGKEQAMKFAEMVGQQELKEYFRRAVAGEHLAHAYLIEGSWGSGKRMLADAAANFLLCQKAGGADSCGGCQDCVQFASGNHPDVIYVQPSKKTGYGVDDIRDMILRELEIRPYQSQYKIYVIAAAESMTVAAQNMLLKTIEEPPAYALFFLLTENKDRLLETVRSRCIHLPVKPLSAEEMREFLRRMGQESREDLIAFAEGSPGRLLQLLDSESFREMKREIENLLDRFIKTPEYDIIELTSILEKYTENLEEVLNTLQITLTERLREIIRRPVRAGSASSISRYYFLSRNLLAAKRQLKANVNKSFVIWSLFLLKENL